MASDHCAQRNATRTDKLKSQTLLGFASSLNNDDDVVGFSVFVENLHVKINRKCGMRHVIYTFDKVSMISTMTWTAAATTSSPMTQIVANRYLQRTTNVAGRRPLCPRPCSCRCRWHCFCNVCVFTPREGEVMWCKSCASSTAAVSQISRGAFDTHPYNNVWKFFSVLVKNEAPHVSDTEVTPYPLSLSLPLRHPFSTLCVSLHPSLSSLVVFNVVFSPSPQPPRSLQRFVLFDKINFNHNFSHRNCNSSMINDCFQHRTQALADPTAPVPVPVSVTFYFSFSNRNLILPERDTRPKLFISL